MNLAVVTYVPTVYVRWQDIRFCFVRHPAVTIAVQSDSLQVFQLQISPAKTSKCPATAPVLYWNGGSCVVLNACLEAEI
jgi:hypothetical protein